MVDRYYCYDNVSYIVNYFYITVHDLQSFGLDNVSVPKAVF